MSNERMAYVAGQFYPSDHESMMGEVRGYLAQADKRDADHTILAMVPHAGYMFSGAVCGRTLGQANLANTILLLGPKHSSLGQQLAVWSAGSWKLPGLSVPVDQGLATALLQAEPRLTKDHAAHEQEHSLEVIIPFLAALNEQLRIVPVALWERDPVALAQLGENIGRAVAAWPKPVSIVVSSDMNHMLPDAITRKLDRMAIDAALSMDPLALFRTVAEHEISMCGVVPMTVGLAAARVLGAKHAELVDYATSGDITSDRSQVVGYAGILLS